MNVIKSLPSSSDAVRSRRVKMVYVVELDALVQEDLLPDLSLCYSNREAFWETLSR